MFLDSMQHYSTSDITRKYTNAPTAATITAGNGYWGGNALTIVGAGNVRVPLVGTPATISCGVRHFSTALDTYQFIGLMDNNTEQCVLRLRADGRVEVRRGFGTTLGISSTAPILSNVWQYIEFLSTINNAVGAYQVRVNGVTVLSGSNVDTQETANAYATNVMFQRGAVGTTRFNDLYVDDVTATLYGDCRVECLFPDGNGATNQWAVTGAVNNWQAVDDATPDDDATYVSTSNPTDIDLYTFGALATPSGSVYAVQAVGCMRKDDAGIRTVSLVARPAAANFFGASQGIAASYAMYREVWATNPAGGAWTIAAVNASEFGVRLDS